MAMAMVVARSRSPLELRKSQLALALGKRQTASACQLNEGMWRIPIIRGHQKPSVFPPTLSSASAAFGRDSDHGNRIREHSTPALNDCSLGEARLDAHGRCGHTLGGTKSSLRRGYEFSCSRRVLRSQAPKRWHPGHTGTKLHLPSGLAKLQPRSMDLHGSTRGTCCKSTLTHAQLRNGLRPTAYQGNAVALSTNHLGKLPSSPCSAYR